MDNINIIKTKKAYKKIFNEYSQSNKTLRLVIIKMLKKFISNLQGNRVLDVGCASGVESKFLFEHKMKVTGIDNSEDFIEIAKKNCPDCNFLVGDMRNTDLPDSVFDGIWASASFLHIPKSEAVKTLKNFRRILNEKGLLYISVMEGDFNGLRDNPQMNWPERHFSDYQKNELENLLINEGFKVLKIFKNTTDWGPVFLHFFVRK